MEGSRGLSKQNSKLAGSHFVKTVSARSTASAHRPPPETVSRQKKKKKTTVPWGQSVLFDLQLLFSSQEKRKNAREISLRLFFSPHHREENRVA